MTNQTKTVAYLSGALRVSTHEKALTYGPRNHVLGTIEGFESNNWKVNPFIAGDVYSARWSQKQFSELSRNSRWRGMAIDGLRMLVNKVSRGIAPHYTGRNVHLAYERFGLFQDLGRVYQRQGVPWVVETNEVYFKEAQSDRNSLSLQALARKHERATYKGCDVLVTITQSLKNLILQEFDIPESKILVLPNASSEHSLVGQPQAVNAKSFKIVFVGLLTEWIGLQTLIEAMSKIDLPIELSIIGEGPYRGVLEALVTKYHLESRVTFCGFIARPDIFQVMNQHDMGYSGHKPLTTNRYHSPMKLYEYLGRALPVMASDDEDSEKILKKDQYGFIFQRESVESLVEALTFAWSKRQQWSQMGWQGCQFIRAEHTWKNRIQDLCQFCKL